jgi:toxin FitB
MKYLLDTCTLSELNRPRPNDGLLSWLSAQTETDLFVSVVVLAELRRGIEKARVVNLAHALRLDIWFDRVVHRFASQTLATDDSIWALWAQLCGQADAAGRAASPIDTLLCATARQHNLTIVTRNVRDFAPYAQIHNPWTASAAA